MSVILNSGRTDSVLNDRSEWRISSSLYSSFNPGPSGTMNSFLHTSLKEFLERFGENLREAKWNLNRSGEYCGEISKLCALRALSETLTLCLHVTPSEDKSTNRKSLGAKVHSNTLTWWHTTAASDPREGIAHELRDNSIDNTARHTKWVCWRGKPTICPFQLIPGCRCNDPLREYAMPTSKRALHTTLTFNKKSIDSLTAY